MSLEDRIVVRFILNFSDYAGDLSDLVLKISYVDGNGMMKRVDVTDPIAYNPGAGLYSFDKERAILFFIIVSGKNPV